MNNIKRERKFIFIAFLALTLFGILMVYESSSVYAFKTYADASYFFKRQLLFFIAGLISFFLTLLVDFELLRRYSKGFLFFTVFILLIVIFMGREAGGAKRWLYLGGFNIQPSEILKISFLLYGADYCCRKRAFLGDIKLGLFPLGIVLGIICLLLLLQPDLGTAVFWVLWAVFFLFLFGARKKHLIVVILLGIVASFFLVKLYPYRFRRITAYFNPFLDPRGSGFQLIQSQIAYGEGGILGVGLGEGRQKLSFLPASHTDFVFSIIAEEFGLVGSLGLFFIFFLLFHKMFKITQNVQNEFRKGILWGIILIFFLEIVINTGVSCGLFPTKGLPLPFVSYGGSNLVVHYILLGLFFNASRAEENITKGPTVS
jgi:cell division protein FtsW